MNEERKSEVDMSAKKMEINGPINNEKSESDEIINFDTGEKKENVIKPDEDVMSNQSEANENNGEQTQIPTCSLEEDQISIEEDDGNDLMSANEISWGASDQSAKSGFYSPLNVSPKFVSMLVTALPTSTKSQNSRSVYHLSSKINSIAPSANLNPNTKNTYNSPSESPGLRFPKMGSSSSIKAIAHVLHSSTRPKNSKLSKID